MNKVKEFKRLLLTFFKDTNKTGWGKNEVQSTITELYVAFLESQIEEEEDEPNTS